MSRTTIQIIGTTQVGPEPAAPSAGVSADTNPPKPKRAAAADHTEEPK